MNDVVVLSNKYSKDIIEDMKKDYIEGEKSGKKYKVFNPSSKFVFEWLIKTINSHFKHTDLIIPVILITQDLYKTLNPDDYKKNYNLNFTFVAVIDDEEKPDNLNYVITNNTNDVIEALKSIDIFK